MRENRILLVFIISITLFVAEVGSYWPISIKNRLENKQTINILLLGSDARPDEINARSDTIIVASFNKEMGRAVLLWIPRDTKVSVEGKERKINMLSQLYGPKKTCSEIEKLLGIRIPYYVLTNFSGFTNIIDILEGIYMDVDIELRCDKSGVYLKKGPQWLNGQETLEYARFRGDVHADIGRTERQQKIIKALFSRLLTYKNIVHLPEIIKELRQNVYTNMSMADMVFLGRHICQLNEDNIITQTLPGYHYVSPYTGASYWQIDEEIARSILDSLYRGHRFDVIQEKPP